MALLHCTWSCIVHKEGRRVGRGCIDPCNIYIDTTPLRWGDNIDQHNNSQTYFHSNIFTKVLVVEFEFALPNWVIINKLLRNYGLIIVVDVQVTPES